MKRFGLIGYPISHSLSPALFKAAYPDTQDFSYDLIEEADFDSAWQRFLGGYDAINVTAPYKGDAFRRVDIADTISRELYAVNIVRRKEGKLYGYNSDFWALQELLRPLAVPGRRTRVLVIGCGGAAKAAALAALKLRMSVSVANRDFRKARDFCFTGGGMIPMRLEQVKAHQDAFDVFIYAIPVKIDLADTLPLAGRTVIEANYKDPCLRERAVAEGANYISGLEWLARQAVSGYRLMTDREPDEACLQAYCAQLSIL